MKTINEVPSYYPSSVYFQKNVIPLFAIFGKCIIAFVGMLLLFLGGAFLVDFVISAMF